MTSENCSYGKVLQTQTTQSPPKATYIIGLPVQLTNQLPTKVSKLVMEPERKTG